MLQKNSMILIKPMKYYQMKSKEDYTIHDHRLMIIIIIKMNMNKNLINSLKKKKKNKKKKDYEKKFN